jgi:phage baseplate assembly protein W
MNAQTGETMPTELAHIQQAIQTILMTPTGTRVMRREFGSFIPDLIDQPLNGATILRLYAAAVMAILRWEPRITVHKISAVVPAEQGSLLLDISITYNGQNASLNVPLLSGVSA